MMNNGMKESVERTIKLPEVEPEVFGKFATYIYTGDYSAASRLENDHSKPLTFVRPNLDFSKLVEAMEDEDNDCFCCAGCHDLITLTKSTSFHHCHACVRGINHHIRYGAHLSCTVSGCPKAPTRAYGTLCETHSKEYGIDNFELIKPLKEFDIPVNFNFARSTSSMSHLYSLRSSEPFVVCASQMLLHNKVVLFAELYGITELHKLAVAKLSATMAIIEVSEAWIDIMVVFLKLVYRNTPDPNPKTPLAGRHLLRRMVAEVFYQRAGHLIRTSALKNVISSIPGIAFDSWLASPS